MFYGSIPALITPFRNNAIDWTAFDALVEWQINEGSRGLVPCGTTGESPTLSHDEHKQVIKRCVAIADGRVPVIAGTGSNATAEALDFTIEAEEDGADAALVVTPYYNKPTQEGLYQHFKTLADNVSIPIIIYNIPGRSAVDMTIDTMIRLAELPNIVGVKDATNDLTRPLALQTRLGDDFYQLSGEDATVTAFLGQGGHGCISVTANIAPRLCAQLHAAWQAGDMQTVTARRATLAPLHAAMFCESSPAPVKYAASRLGFGTDEVRLPLLPASLEARALIDTAMDEAGLKPA